MGNIEYFTLSNINWMTSAALFAYKVKLICVSVSVCLSVCLSVSLSVYVSVYLSVYLSD